MAWGDDQIRDRVIRTILGESNGSPEGMVSVAHVMKNRADSGTWGDRTNGGLTRAITAHKQFSMWNTDDPKLRALAAGVNAIPTSDPRYQRAAAIADGVFSEQIPDPTNGATHYHTTSVSPGWSQGQRPVATIGGHYFYKLPLSASNTAGTAVTSPSMVGVGGSAAPPAPAPAAPGSQFGPNDVYANIPVKDDRGEDQIAKFKSWNPDPIGTEKARLAQVHPDMQAIVNKVRADNPNLNFVVGSGLRSQADQQNAYNWGWSTVDPAKVRDVNQRGIAADLWPLDANNRVTFDPDRQAQLAVAMKTAAQQLGVPITWGGDWKTFKDRPHFQLDNPRPGYTPGAPLSSDSTPATTVVTAPVVKLNAPAAQAQPVAATAPAAPGQGGVGSDARIPLGTAPAGTPPAVSTIVSNPNVPAANAQPVSATAPAAPAAPGNEKYPVIARMTTGTSRNPELITAANWGNLFGGSTPARPTPDLAQRVPLDQTPTPPVRPADPPAPPAGPIGTPASTAPIGSPLSSILPGWGAGSSPYDREAHPSLPPGAGMPGGEQDRYPATTEGQPSMGFPAMTNPFGQPQPDQQTSMLPGSMLASAQELIRRLFPSSIG